MNAKQPPTSIPPSPSANTHLPSPVGTPGNAPAASPANRSAVGNPVASPAGLPRADIGMSIQKLPDNYQGRKVKSSALNNIVTLMKLLARIALRKGRLLTVAALVVGALGVAVFARSDQATAIELITTLGLNLVMPLSALILAVPVFSDLVEDRLLAYLILKPLPRWQLALAATTVASLSVAAVIALPMGVMAAIMGEANLVLPAVLASALGAITYGALYVALGAWFKQGLIAALVYLVVWENTLSRFGEGVRRLSVRSYINSIFLRTAEIFSPRPDATMVVAIAVLLILAVLATVATTFRLSSRDVD